MGKESGAGELHPERRPGEPDLQGAPAPLLSGEGSVQQGQGVAQTDGAGERAQHQVVAPPTHALGHAPRSTLNQPLQPLQV